MSPAGPPRIQSRATGVLLSLRSAWFKGLANPINVFESHLTESRPIAGQEPQDKAQRGQHTYKVGARQRTGMSRQVFGEQPIGCTKRYKKKHALSHQEPES